jgi:beta propeller repeat protein
LTNKPLLKQFKKIALAIFPILIVLLLTNVTYAAEVLQEFWSAFLIEEDDVSGAVAIYGNKVAKQGFDLPAEHLVIIDLLNGSTRHYGANEYVWGIDWVDMDGDWVVTSNNAPPDNPDTIHAINLVTDEHVVVAPFPGYFVNNEKPAIDGDNIVWMQYRQCCAWDLVHFDLQSRTTISITNDGWQNQEHWPDVSGDWVVWNNGSSQNGDIYAYNMATTELVTVTQDADPQWYPKIDGNLLTWTDSRRGPQYRDIYGFDLKTRQEFPLVVSTQPAYAQDIDGNILTWYKSTNGPASQIYARNLDTGETTLIYETIPPSMPYGPTFLSGNTVLWVFAEEGNYTEPRLYGARRLTYQSYLPVLVGE